MKNLIVISLILSCVVSVLAQVPQVPKEMDWAGMHLKINNSARLEIQKSVDKLHQNKSYFDRYVEKADMFFPLIEKEFASVGVPHEIKYLCIQESGFKADAVSSSNAVGYWQFKEATGIEQGLVINNKIDERKNIVQSSFAAAKYCLHHKNYIGNWVYAITAYNTGLTGARKYYNIEDSLSTNKMHITKKTHWYFLKYLAHVVAFQDYVGKNKPATGLKVSYNTAGKTLKDFADQYNLTLEEIKKYNLWIALNYPIPTDQTYPVIIPVPYDKINDPEPETLPKEEEPEEPLVEYSPEDLDATEEAKPDKSLKIPNSHKKGDISVSLEEGAKKNLRYKVNGIPAITAIAGDNSSLLSNKGGIVKSKFLKYNELSSFDEIIPGQTYFLKAKKVRAKTNYHVVQYGETLWSISQLYGVKSAAIRRKNRMSKTEALVPGRMLFLKTIRPEDEEIRYVAVNEPAEEVIENKSEDLDAIENEAEQNQIETPTDEDSEEGLLTKHIIIRGETLYSISRLYGISVEELMNCNQLTSDLLPESMKYLKICDPNYENKSEEKPLNEPQEEELLDQVESQPIIHSEDAAASNLEDADQPEELDMSESVEDEVITIDSTDNKPIEESTIEESIVEEPIIEEDSVIEKTTFSDTTNIVLETESTIEVEPVDSIQIPSVPDVNTEELATEETIVEEQETMPDTLTQNDLIDDATYIEVLVEPGTTLYGLSRKYGVTTDEIKSLNGLTSCLLYTSPSPRDA